MCFLCVRSDVSDDNFGWLSHVNTQTRSVDETQDAAADASTMYSVQVGDVFYGNRDSFSDRDWIAVDLVEGENYVFTMTVTTMRDPHLSLFGPDRASSSATGTAQLAVTTQSDAYVLQHGDVTASLDLDQPKVAVDLQWTDDGITYVSGASTQSSPTVFSAKIITTLHATDPCVADNLFCGGSLLLSADIVIISRQHQ